MSDEVSIVSFVVLPALFQHNLMKCWFMSADFQVKNLPGLKMQLFSLKLCLSQFVVEFHNENNEMLTKFINLKSFLVCTFTV